MIGVYGGQQCGAPKEVGDDESQEENDQTHEKLRKEQEELSDQLLESHHAQRSRPQENKGDTNAPEGQPAEQFIGRRQRSFSQDRGEIGGLKKLVELYQGQGPSQDEFEKQGNDPSHGDDDQHGKHPRQESHQDVQEFQQRVAHRTDDVLPHGHLTSWLSKSQSDAVSGFGTG